MNRQQLVNQIKQKKSFLCVGLDTDISLIPSFLLDFADPVFEFNKRIIDATHDLCVAYKPNSAFYESRGIAGWQSLIMTSQHIPKTCLGLIDAKRGDIGNTSTMYAKAFFDKESSGMSFDAITVAPYMGIDSVKPFLEFEGKWVVLLALTSNEGGKNFQFLTTGEQRLFETVIDTANTWAGNDRIMYVVGATRSEEFINIRKHAPDHFLLVPGIGAQGGSLQEVAKFGINNDCGLLVNSSRSIIYASRGEDFAEKAREEALKLQQEMSHILEENNLI
ncbi:orotidine-5'-phosphate decarboxylase [Daejeonella lutea]|uniref:Orotidine-5'-phosphate decarboxylase n=1 Tax=Daejeonella lutea TaxID=572036 RepID=A0A1T5AUZ9_9SPHI|nr:orotidine-5'-phosphate decarboxylase [Daejeonella lutea]SKB38629.1 orotidine-5'-phosphate decarboxylase [Daejeonella lutea]